jgi:hypothetical protein
MTDEILNIQFETLLCSISIHEVDNAVAGRLHFSRDGGKAAVWIRQRSTQLLSLILVCRRLQPHPHCSSARPRKRDSKLCRH